MNELAVATVSSNRLQVQPKAPKIHSKIQIKQINRLNDTKSARVKLLTSAGVETNFAQAYMVEFKVFFYPIRITATGDCLKAKWGKVNTNFTLLSKNKTA